MDILIMGYLVDFVDCDYHFLGVKSCYRVMFKFCLDHFHLKMVLIAYVVPFLCQRR